MGNGQRTSPPAVAAGEKVGGFQIDGVFPVPEIRATAYLATHLATGARLMQIHCEDRENLFAITFRTPPHDSTGVAHIMEHSVLAGSERYPVKDAFNELGKGSMKTFLNAFTAPDFTTYPVASQVPADFYNLVSVYTDLVLRPLLNQDTFLQEGHHLEVDPDGELRISGIVYNEMKGAYASAEVVAERATLQGLFPDTPYAHESGGHPESIPGLTYEGFREFHRRYYSPSNAWIFLYGDLPIRDQLEFLTRELEGLPRTGIDSAIPDQAFWAEPRRARITFPVGDEDSLERRATVNLAWLTAPTADGETRLILEVVQEALVGNEGSPLRKALIDSGLGEDLSPTTGLQPWFRQIPFVVGLRGTDAARGEEIEQLTLRTLQTIVREGFPVEVLEGAFHQVEFQGLEISRRPFPFPLQLLLRSLGNWLHEADPVAPLRFPSLIEGLRERWGREPDLFSQAIRRWLLGNPHRLLVVVEPSRTLAAEQDARLRQRLNARKEAMIPGELDQLRQRAASLLEAQRRPEAPEALALLPVLRVEDVPRDVERIPCSEVRSDGIEVLEHDLFSNGVGYLDLVFDLSDLPDDLQPSLPLLGAALTGMGAGGLGYEAFARRKARALGGLSVELRSVEALNGRGGVPFLALRARALRRNASEMAAIVGEIATAGDLDDHVRFREILQEERNDLRSEVGPRGHIFVLRAAAAALSVPAWREEQWHGVTQIRFLSDLIKRYEAESHHVVEQLARLREWVFRRGRMTVNLTGDSACLEAMRGPVAELAARVPKGPGAGSIASASPNQSRTGVAIPGEVCYVGRVLPAPPYDHPLAPAVLTVANHLSEGIIYQRVRVEGGAYGGFAVYNPNLGQFALLSYRDPHLEETFDVYDGALDAFLSEPFTDDDLRKAILGTVSGLDRPMDPAMKGFASLERRRTGLTDEVRERFRAAVLGMTAAEMRRAVEEILKPAMSSAREAVLAPRPRIEKANRELTRPFEIRGLE